jgi:hypothetical protein
MNSDINNDVNIIKNNSSSSNNDKIKLK